MAELLPLKVYSFTFKFLEKGCQNIKMLIDFMYGKFPVSVELAKIPESGQTGI